MQIKLPFNLKQLILKAIIYFLVFYFILIAISIAITGYLFFSLDSYKTRIEKVVTKHTGYNLTVGDIKTKLNKYFLPKIVISKIKVVNPKNLQQNFAINSVEFVFSYSSIWNLEPIFQTIKINGTEIDVKYTKDQSIIVNGINLIHPDKTTLENTKNSPIDLEKWILKQNHIQLSDIDLDFTDSMHDLPKMELHNIRITLDNGYFDHHNLALKLNAGNADGSVLGANLSWVGGKLSEFNKFSSADLKIQTYNSNDPITGTIKRYLPNLAFLDAFNAQTALNAQIKHGKLQYLYADFNIKNLKYFWQKNPISFPQIGGRISIALDKNNTYMINANGLTLSTSKGYVLNNKKITGSYIDNKSGQISMDQTQLSTFNNLLDLYPITKDFAIDGMLKLTKFNWDGNVFKPSNFNLYIRFVNLALISKNKHIPSMNNISGDISLTKKSGSLNLVLNNSTLKYDNVFLKPFIFKKLYSTIKWQLKNKGIIAINLESTTISTNDFDGQANGTYTYTPNTLGYIDLNAHINKMPISEVGYSLPVQIGKDVVKWLHTSLVSGYGEDGNLKLKGSLEDFPYSNGKGIFHITAKVNDGKLNYIDKWPTIDHVMGLFEIDNQKIIIKATSAKISGNTINDALVIIPDMTADHAYLIADGNGSGSTSNFMNYLAHTPINEILGNLPKETKTTSNGNVKLHLKVPFDHPDHTQVDGTYTMSNNSIKFLNLPIPDVDKINGSLSFSDHGLEIKQLDANALNSKISLNVYTKADGDMHFTVKSPNLDYQQVAQTYISLIQNFTHGRAPTTIEFDVNTKGFRHFMANSNLNGVILDLPTPLAKTGSDNAILNFGLNPLGASISSGFGINFDYNKLLSGDFNLNSQGELTNGNLLLGTKSNLTSDYFKHVPINISSAFDELAFIDWIDAIKKMLSSNQSQDVSSMTDSKRRDYKKSSPSHADGSSNFMPINITIITKNVMVGDTGFGRTLINALVSESNSSFNVTGDQISGMGNYNYKPAQLDLDIYQLFLYNDGQAKLKSVESINSALLKNHNYKKLKTESIQIEDILKQGIKKQSLVNESSPISIPQTILNLANLYINNHNLGHLKVRLSPRAQHLLVESGNLSGNLSSINFSGTNYCMQCVHNNPLVNLNIHGQFHDFGTIIENLNFGRILNKGDAKLDVWLQWDGQMQDFSVSNTTAKIDLTIKDGKFLKVNTDNVLGSILGIINLQTIVNIAKLRFGDIFINGFYFSNLTVNAYLYNDQLGITNLDMNGTLATVKSHGIIDLDKQLIDMRLTVTPKLGASVAVGAAIATANPIVGVVTYAAEWILGQPFSKLFTFTYDVTGSISDPQIKQIGVSKQIIKNVSSTVDNPHPQSISPVF